MTTLAFSASRASGNSLEVCVIEAFLDSRMGYPTLNSHTTVQLGFVGKHSQLVLAASFTERASNQATHFQAVTWVTKEIPRPLSAMITARK